MPVGAGETLGVGGETASELPFSADEFQPNIENMKQERKKSAPSHDG
jgi:hypothetical protein